MQIRAAAAGRSLPATRIGAAALALLLGAGCTHYRISVAPREILHHVPELRAHARARVDVFPRGTVDIDVDRVFAVDIGGKRRRLSVRQLIAHCPDVAPFSGDTYRGNPPCLLLGVRDTRLPLGTRTRYRHGAVFTAIGSVLVISAILLVGGYIATCAAPDDGC